MSTPVAAGALGIVSVVIANLLALQEPTTPVFLVPAMNLTAVIAFSAAMGSMMNRVKQVEKDVALLKENLLERRRKL